MSWGLGSVWLGGDRKKRQNPRLPGSCLSRGMSGWLVEEVRQNPSEACAMGHGPWAMGLGLWPVPLCSCAPVLLCPCAPLPLCPFAPLPLPLPFCHFAFFCCFFSETRQHHTTKRHVQVRPRAELHHRRSHVLTSWRSGTCTLPGWRYHTGRSRSSHTVHQTDDRARQSYGTLRSHMFRLF